MKNIQSLTLVETLILCYVSLEGKQWFSNLLHSAFQPGCEPPARFFLPSSIRFLKMMSLTSRPQLTTEFDAAQAK